MEKVENAKTAKSRMIPVRILRGSSESKDVGFGKVLIVSETSGDALLPVE
jgi:hypothetical protein